MATVGGGHHHHLTEHHYHLVRDILHNLDHRVGSDFQTGSGIQGSPAIGSATLYGGAPHAVSPGADSVLAGSGNATMIGSAQPASVGGSFSQMIAQGANDSGGGGHSNVFAFDQSIGGGQHLIPSFAQGPDKPTVLGTDSTGAIDHPQVTGTSAVISLDGGKTQIVLNGVTHFGKHD
jgi:hypothetical protein